MLCCWSWSISPPWCTRSISGSGLLRSGSGDCHGGTAHKHCINCSGAEWRNKTQDTCDSEETIHLIMLKETCLFQRWPNIWKACREGDHCRVAEGRCGGGRGRGGEGGGLRRWNRIWENLRSRGQGRWWLVKADAGGGGKEKLQKLLCPLHLWSWCQMEVCCPLPGLCGRKCWKKIIDNLHFSEMLSCWTCVFLLIAFTIGRKPCISLEEVELIF